MYKLVAIISVAAATIILTTANPTDWKTRRDSITNRVAVWNRNDTGSHNGNENLAGKELI